MARLLALATALAALAARPARADEADDLVAQGDELARRHEYAQAIEKFKAADRIRARVKNTCMIGLANLRRQHLGEAEMYLERCRSRATADDPAPDWLADAETQLAAQLATADLSVVDIRVVPATAQIRLSSFAIDESFAPRIVHLAPGRQTITVTAPGFATMTREITVIPKTDQVLELELVNDTPAVPAPVVERAVTPIPPPADAPSEHGSAWSTRLLVVGAGAVVGAVVLHGLAFHTRDALANPTSADAYHADERTFDLERAGAISLYAIAAVAIGAGLYLRLSHHDHGARIGATYTGGAGLVTIGWRR